LKKYLVSIALLTFIAACGGGTSSESKSDTTASTSSSEAPATGDVLENPDYKKGLSLIGKSDCLTCHKVSEKLIGPAYKDVASKYAGADTAVTYLAGKIIKGGSGVWGTVPMTPHPQISEPDAEQMVKYILLLKNAQ
jgi:cytochrome c